MSTMTTHTRPIGNAEWAVGLTICHYAKQYPSFTISSSVVLLKLILMRQIGSYDYSSVYLLQIQPTNEQSKLTLDPYVSTV